MKIYVEDILGLKPEANNNDDKLKAVMDILIEMRKHAKEKKDWVTSDNIRNQLALAGIELKDEKDGGMSWRKA